MQPLEAPRYPFTSSLTRKGQVTIPAEIRRKLGLKRGDKVAFIESDGQVQVAAAQSVTERTAGMLRSPLPALSPAEEQAVIEEAWAAEATQHGI